MNENIILDAPDSPQNNTLLFNAVQKWVGYAEYIPLLVASLGIFFKYQAIPKGSELVTIGFLTYAGVLLVMPFIMFQARGIWQILLSYVAGFGFAIMLIGILFKIQNWPYAHEMFTISILVLPIVLGLAIIYLLINLLINLNNKQARNFCAHIIVRTLCIMMLGYTIGIPLIILYKIVQPLIFKPR